MRILFWNTHRNTDINKYIVSLIRDYDIDVLAMAEYCADNEELKMLLEQNHQRFVPCYTEGCSRIDVCQLVGGEKNELAHYNRNVDSIPEYNNE